MAHRSSHKISRLNVCIQKSSAFGPCRAEASRVFQTFQHRSAHSGIRVVNFAEKESSQTFRRTSRFVERARLALLPQIRRNMANANFGTIVIEREHFSSRVSAETISFRFSRHCTLSSWVEDGLIGTPKSILPFRQSRKNRHIQSSQRRADTQRAACPF